MNIYYTIIFVSIVCFLVQVYIRKSKTNENSHLEESYDVAQFNHFQKVYLIIFSCAMTADWLQGPYVYALYESYGFEKQDIGYLFIAGFGSSLFFGTFAGSLADKYGRKLFCLLYGIFYILSCTTKLYSNFNILLVGRILGGISTSLLFSSFEAWMVTQHKEKKFYPGFKLQDTFQKATFLGNGLIPILSGFVASFVAHHFGLVAPFLASIVVLVITSLLVFFCWEENFGSSVNSTGTFQIFETAFVAAKTDSKIILLGSIQSLFESAMYIFVFMWTPALSEESDQQLNLGLIFSAFMISVMIGSSMFGLFVATYSPQKICFYNFILAAFSLILPYFYKSYQVRLIAFFIFEFCCGLYFPAIGTLRGEFIPKETRSTLMNFFRVPLNFTVVLMLSNLNSFNTENVFFACSCLLTFACILQYNFNHKLEIGNNNEIKEPV